MDKAKKKRLKQYIAWISLAALVALLVAMPLLARSEAEEDGPVASILEGAVQMGSVETGLRGGGTLSAGNAENVELPKGVKITRFLVRNGDLVSKGDPVAEVDSVSVMSAIVQVRDTLEYLQEEMADAKDESAASTVKATAGGLVKQVYAQAGDSVQDVMLRHGALAVLSLDGMMAVDLEARTDLAAGDTVQVAFGDGGKVSGRVESNLDGRLVVTVNDKDYAVGEPVSVSGTDGAPIGSGTLYVHNAWKATAFTGTVKTVSARENTEVYDGATLFTLKDTDFSGTLESLASLHREYEELLQKLFVMYETEVLTAPCDGKVSGVDTDSEFLLSDIQGGQGWFVDLLDNSSEEKGWTVLLLSNEQTGCTGREDCEAEEHEPGCAVYCTMLPDCANQNHRTGCLGVCTGNGDTCQSTRGHEYHEPTCRKRCTGAEGCDAVNHQDACIERCTVSDDDSCPALNHKEGCYYHGVTYTAYAVKITLIGTDGVQAIPGESQTVYTVEPDGDGWKLVAPETIVDQFPGMSGVEYVGPALPADCGVGDIVLIVTGTNSENQTVYYGASVYQKAQSGGAPGIPEIPGFPGGMGGFGDLSSLFGGMGGMAGLYGSQNTGYELYDLNCDVLMTVTEQDVMTLSITLDEQDIAGAALGQTAQVKVGPLKDKLFEAEVTQIGLFGVNSGGSSKFTVELTMPLAEGMLPGMSATAYIPLYTKMNVLTVPVAALVEEGGRTLICTALDPETGEPSNPVEVVTGVSDGITAEVLSGLESGDVYYYSYYDTLELSTEVETDKYTFG